MCQGSILGPLLYVAYTNGIGNIPFTGNSCIVQYADDLVLICPIDTDHSCFNAQENVNLIVNFLSSLSLAVNRNKTKCQVFSRTGKTQFVPHITIGDSIVNCVNNFVYLGVKLDPKLDYSSHTAAKIATVKRAAGHVSRTFKKFIPFKTFSLLYYRIPFCVQSYCMLLKFLSTLYKRPSST